MNKEAVIFGAGEWGRIAYYYYSKSINIICYVDNDKSIWNTQLNNLPICSPDILKENEYVVVIASKYFENTIKKQLFQEYGINKAIVFEINERVQEIYCENSIAKVENELIIAFKQGLGNQMFQYALYKVFIKLRKHVRADLSAYLKPDMMPFELSDVFPNIQLLDCNQQLKDAYLKGKDKVYIETLPQGENGEMYCNDLLKMEFGYIEGWHCSYKYPEMVRDELLKDFEFSHQRSEKLNELTDFFTRNNIVGVHVRRGDFLSPKYQRELGSICSKEYYMKAMEYIKQKCSGLIFCFFSDDIEWVKNTFNGENIIYIEKSMFEEYHNWYDLYLMSICKHNIIPNSTFGWWGAWLNQNINKVVIAPKRCRKSLEIRDWCPPEWILI